MKELLDDLKTATDQYRKARNEKARVRYRALRDLGLRSDLARGAALWSQVRFDQLIEHLKANRE